MPRPQLDAIGLTIHAPRSRAIAACSASVSAGRTYGPLLVWGGAAKQTPYLLFRPLRFTLDELWDDAPRPVDCPWELSYQLARTESRLLRTLLLQRDTYAAQALELVERGGGVARTWELAAESAQNAANLLQILPASAARDALVVLCHKVLNADDPNDPRS